MQVDDMQGLVCDDHACAVEHFLLNDPKVQQQLFKYLELLPEKDLEKEGMPSNADQDQQQSWILQKAAADYTSFVASTAQLALSVCPDITVDHLQPEAADVIVEQYAKQLGHSLQQWTDSTVALANTKQVLDGLGLASVAWQSQEAAIAHAVAVNGTQSHMQMLLLLTLIALQIWALSCCRYNCIQQIWHVVHESHTLCILLGVCFACSPLLHLPPTTPSLELGCAGTGDPASVIFPC